MQAEGDAATARGAVASLEERHASMAAANRDLARRVATLVRLGAEMLQGGRGGVPMPIASSPLLREFASCRLAESY